MDAVSYDENPCVQLLAGFGLSMPKRGLKFIIMHVNPEEQHKGGIQSR